MYKKIIAYLPLLFILLYAAFLRLYHIADYMTFLGDEGRDALVVYNILHGKLTLLGPTASVGGFFFGPIYYYFMAPFLWLFHYNPVGPAVMVALFGIFTIYFVYKIGAEFFSKPVGFLASLLYTMSPVVISYSRSSWNPNLLAPFTIFCLYALYKGLTDKKLQSKSLFSLSGTVWMFLLSGFSFGIELQLHYVSLFITPVIAVYTLLVIWWQLRTKKEKIIQLCQTFLQFTGGFLIGFSAMLAFEVRHEFANTRHILMFILESKDTGAGGQFLPTVGDVFVRSFTRLVAQLPNLPQEMSQAMQKQIQNEWHIGCAIVWSLIFLGFTYITFQMKKNKEIFLKFILIWLWFVIPVVIFGLYKKSIYDYYFQIFFPLPFLITSFVLISLWKTKVGKIISLLIIFILITVNILGTPFRYPGNKQLQQSEIIAKAVYEEAGGKPFNFALITGGNSDHAYRYFLTLWGNPPVTIQFPGIDPDRKSVTNQLLVVCESIPCQPEGNGLWEIAGFGRAQIIEKKHISVVDLYKLTHYSGK